jgi:hypothetical protein
MAGSLLKSRNPVVGQRLGLMLVRQQKGLFFS